MKWKSTPFGMLFAESAHSLIKEQQLVPEYSFVEGISYVTTNGGERVPYVMFAANASGTQTVTEVRTEATDADPGDNQPMFMTQTETRIQAEGTDTDPTADRPLLATQTETKVRNESTDKD